LLHRTIAVSRAFGDMAMFKPLFRLISNLFTPGLRMMAAMPPSAVRQVLFPLSGV
jgi:hypothetical protein